MPDIEYQDYIFFPEGLSFSKGILTISEDKKYATAGLVIEKLMKITNTTHEINGTENNLCLENAEAEYLIKSKPETSTDKKIEPI